MNENQGDKKHTEKSEEYFPECLSHQNSKNYTHEFLQANDDEHKFDFLIQDMFLDHFFP